eukprot:s877_g12.t1
MPPDITTLDWTVLQLFEAMARSHQSRRSRPSRPKLAKAAPEAERVRGAERAREPDAAASWEMVAAPERGALRPTLEARESRRAHVLHGARERRALNLPVELRARAPAPIAPASGKLAAKLPPTRRLGLPIGKVVLAVPGDLRERETRVLGATAVRGGPWSLPKIPKTVANSRGMPADGFPLKSARSPAPSPRPGPTAPADSWKVSSRLFVRNISVKHTKDASSLTHNLTEQLGGSAVNGTCGYATPTWKFPGCENAAAKDTCGMSLAHICRERWKAPILRALPRRAPLDGGGMRQGPRGLIARGRILLQRAAVELDGMSATIARCERYFGGLSAERKMGAWSHVRERATPLAARSENDPGRWRLPDSARDDLSCLDALVIGPPDTPYDGALLHFQLQVSGSYPLNPPEVRFLTTEAGELRLHPQLYADGKVCLSILGTWHGPRWTASSSIRTVLLSIQSLLCEDPLRCEPGMETAPDDKVELANVFVVHESVRVGILSMLESGPSWGEEESAQVLTSAAWALAVKLIEAQEAPAKVEDAPSQGTPSVVSDSEDGGPIL